MANETFELITQTRKRYILHPSSGLRVNVMINPRGTFAPDQREACIFAHATGKRLVFETVGITADRALHLCEALNWYQANHAPGMYITLDNTVPAAN